MPFFDMDDAAAYRIVGLLCPVALVIGLCDLNQALNRLDAPVIAVSMLVIAIVVAAMAWAVGLPTGTGGDDGKRR